jgi:hypothetical protein
MEIGIGFWILFFVIFVGCGKMLGWGARRHKERHRMLGGCCGREEEEEEEQLQDDRLSKLESRVRGLDRRSRERDRLIRPAMHRRDEGRQPELARMKEKAPTQLEILQQKFIEGRLSMEEYERELDRLEKLE